MDQDNKNDEKPLSYGEDYRLDEKVDFLYALGFNPFNMKLAVKAYKHSHIAMKGIHIRMNECDIYIGPQTKKTLKLVNPPLKLLHYYDMNPFAIRAISMEFHSSKLNKTGGHFLIDDVRVMVGPQKRPEIVR